MPHKKRADADDPASLTLKQRKWLEVYLDTGSATEAAMQAYNCKDRASAGVVGCNTLKSIKGATRALMEKCGITDKVLYEKLAEGLDANRTVFAQFEGAFTDERDCVDFPTRQRYLDTAAKLTGMYAPEQHEISGPGQGPIYQTIYEVADGNGDSGQADGDGASEGPAEADAIPPGD